MLVLVANVEAARPKDSDSKPTAATASRAHPRIHHPYQVGRASWYGKHFHGKVTASGERYNMFQFTAAHPRLPLGTMVRVTNLQNGRWVIVRVNDRGPVPKSRIIDLSYGAAQILGLRCQGLERVRLDLVESTELASVQPEIAGIQ
jgi:rare lipoprotein A